MYQSYNTRLKEVAFKLIELYNIKVTKTTFFDSIQDNPYFPSLYSLSDTFSTLKIENDAYEVPKEKFTELDPPFIAYVKVPKVGKDFVLVTKITSDAISFFYNSKNNYTISQKEFLQNYLGIILVVRPNSNSGDINYEIKKQEEKKILNRKRLLQVIGFLLLLLSFSFQITTENIYSFSSIAIIKSLGLFVSILLILFDLDKNNDFIKNICLGEKQFNCDSVLNSKGSKIFGISWSEIGAIYFFSSLAFLILPKISFDIKIQYLAIFNSMVVPYTVFSIYYQWKIVRQWCPLCLMIQLVLILEFIWGLINFWSDFQVANLTSADINLFLSCILFSIFFWCLLKPILYNSKNYGIYKSAYNRIHFNKDVFFSLLKQNSNVPNNWQDIGITMGNSEATNTIIKVCNPYCVPCSKAHNKLENLLRTNSNLKVKILFKFNDADDRSRSIVTHLLSLASEGDKLKTEQALRVWYGMSKKSLVHFIAQFPLINDLQGNEHSLEVINSNIIAMKNWCIDADVTHTPTYFFNQHRLPEGYVIEDLIKIL